MTFADAFNKGDAAAVAAHYAEDAAVLPPDSPRIDGRTGIEAFWKGAITAGVSDLSLKAVPGRAAWVIHVSLMIYKASPLAAAEREAETSDKLLIVRQIVDARKLPA